MREVEHYVFGKTKKLSMIIMTFREIYFLLLLIFIARRISSLSHCNLEKTISKPCDEMIKVRDEAIE